MQPTANLNKRFCKDLNLPIKIFIEPYFSQRINLYDVHFGCKSKYEAFCKLLEKYKTEEEFFNEYNNFKEEVIQYISKQPSFINFNNENMTLFNHDLKFPHGTIYKVDHIGKYFISIDLCKGNFTALRHYSDNIFNNANNYEDFLKNFTNNEHFIESKYIRQVIFGTLNPKRQVKYEEFLMSKIWEKLSPLFDDSQVVFFSTDEIVLHVDQNDITDKLKNFFKELTIELFQQKIPVKIEFFNLTHFPEHESYIKNISYSYSVEKGESTSLKKSIKNATSLTLPFLLRNIYDLPPDDLDNYFIYEGKLAKFVNS